jgi:plasmid stability protein
MSVSITIRHVPEDVRARLADKAARSGRSLQEYLAAELRQLAFRPSPVDFVHGLENRVELDSADVAVEDILAARDADRR